jgi:hypothetical protein
VVLGDVGYSAVRVAVVHPPPVVERKRGEDKREKREKEKEKREKGNLLCFALCPASSSSSPTNSLTSVVFPAPFRPTTATYEYMRGCMREYMRECV